MRCPNLTDLPVPARGRDGWPWTDETPPLADRMPDGRRWPRITIVTPTYNGGEFLEEAIRSVLLQGYPDLELIVVDGGSIDGSVEVIKAYDPWLTSWVSERDHGQSHAINKGFARATGAVLQWINADDLLTPGALAEVGRLAAEHPDRLIAGGCEWFGEGLRRQIVYNETLSRSALIAFWREEATFQQPSLFVPRSMAALAGPLDETLDGCMDYDWYIRLLGHASVVYTREVLSQFRIHPGSKSVRDAQAMGDLRTVISARYWNELGAAQAARECSAYCRAAAPLSEWNTEIFHLLRSLEGKRTKTRRLLGLACQSPVRLARKQTWGALRRIFVAPR